MSTLQHRPMVPGDRSEVAELICLSTNYWYQAHGFPRIFSGGPDSTVLFFDVYSALPGSFGVVAEDLATGRLAGSCFYHIRPTHVSLGIMNVHPNCFGRGVARGLLEYVIDIANQGGKPLRLVSSAMNLDSYSLYTRAGFVPRAVYQDMILPVPESGLDRQVPGNAIIREGRQDDVPRMAELELAVSHIRRDDDYRHFLENPEGIWHVSIRDGAAGEIDGFLVSCSHAGCNMLGPGVMRDQETAAALILAELDRHRGRSPVFLVPVAQSDLVRQAYSWGARNCEMHFSQVLGEFTPLEGVYMPTFMPETG